MLSNHYICGVYMPYKYVGISIPKELIEQIMETTNHLQGYNSLTEFIKEAIRLRLNEIQTFRAKKVEVNERA